MKRDMALMRRLLLAAAGESGAVTVGDPEVLAEHRLLLAESGWIQPQGLTTAGLGLVEAWREEQPFLAVLRFLEAQALGHTAPLICESLTSYRQSSLAARRIDLGLLQSQVAHRAGLVTSTICRCEREVRLPQSLVAVRSYAAALQLTEAELRALVAHPQPALQEA
jgi:DNA-binding XRE family transcriptional regulator